MRLTSSLCSERIQNNSAAVPEYTTARKSPGLLGEAANTTSFSVYAKTSRVIVLRITIKSHSRWGRNEGRVLSALPNRLTSRSFCTVISGRSKTHPIDVSTMRHNAHRIPVAPYEYLFQQWHPHPAQ